MTKIIRYEVVYNGKNGKHEVMTNLLNTGWKIQSAYSASQAMHYVLVKRQEVNMPERDDKGHFIKRS